MHIKCGGLFAIVRSIQSLGIVHFFSFEQKITPIRFQWVFWRKQECQGQFEFEENKLRLQTGPNS